MAKEMVPIQRSDFRVPEEFIGRVRVEKKPDESKCDELPPVTRTSFMRDRDRVLYSASFRRLAGKTQIYTVNAVDDHRKNRLTHTLEVAQIARTIARALGLDQSLAEAIALGHDLGHTPFGHAGENMLHDIMSPRVAEKCVVLEGSPFSKHEKASIREIISDEKKAKVLKYAYGFKHNIQSARMAAMLERGYKADDGSNRDIGLDLTNYTLYGMMTHSSLVYADKFIYKEKDKDEPLQPCFQKEFIDRLMMRDPEENGRVTNTYAWSFEAFIVEWADDIAQWHHDLEDALLDGVMPWRKIVETVERALGKAIDEQKIEGRKEKLASLKKAEGSLRHDVTTITSIVVDTLVTDLVKTSLENFGRLKKIVLEKRKKHWASQLEANDIRDFFLNYQNYTDEPEVKSPKDAFGWVISVSGNVDKREFKETIRSWIHHSRNVERMNAKGQYIIKELFAAYLKNPQLLPDGTVLRLVVDMRLSKSIESARKGGIGAARAKLEENIKGIGIETADDIYKKCLLMRRICDHIASMTDRYAVEEYRKLYG